MSTERVRHEVRGLLSGAGLSGSFLVRDLSTGEEIGIDPEVEFPIASLVKVPLAIAVASRIHHGRLDGAAMIEVLPGKTATASGGPGGLSRFRHPARIAVDDLLYLSMAMSDNAAADVLFDRVPPAEVDQAMRQAGINGITVRHRLCTGDSSTRSPTSSCEPRPTARRTSSCRPRGLTDLGAVTVSTARTDADTRPGGREQPAG
jgi:beta-lactamase class A